MFTVRNFHGMRVVDDRLANLDEIKLVIQNDCRYEEECHRFYAVSKDNETKVLFFIEAEYIDDGDWVGKISTRIGDTDDWTTSTWEWLEDCPLEGAPWA